MFKEIKDQIENFSRELKYIRKKESKKETINQPTNRNFVRWKNSAKTRTNGWYTAF